MANSVTNVAGAKKISIGGLVIYMHSTAITANVTTTTAPAGSLGKTSHATGLSSLFRSDGSKWQFLVNA